MGRRKDEKEVRQLGLDYVDTYSTELNKGFADLGHRADTEELFVCHRQATLLACAVVLRKRPDVPGALLAAVEENALQDMLPSIGTTDPQPFLMLMIQSAIDAKKSGDANMTTPYALVLADQMGLI